MAYRVLMPPDFPLGEVAVVPNKLPNCGPVHRMSRKEISRFINPTFLRQMKEAAIKKGATEGELYVYVNPKTAGVK